MWPWEHLAVGYLLYSGWLRLRYDRTPGGWDAVVLGVTTQIPDLIDKPLAWKFGVLPSGISLGHSLFLAVPVSILALWRCRPSVGWAVAIGYGSHLLGDLLYPALTGTIVGPTIFLWPVVPADPGNTAFAPTIRRLFEQFLVFLSSERGQLYALFEGLLLGVATVIWVADGLPGLRDALGYVRTAARRS